MTNKNKEVILIKENGRVFAPFLSDIRLIESVGNYARYYWSDGIGIKGGSLNKFIDTYQSQGFIRVNRQWAVNTAYITEFINAGYGEGYLLIGNNRIVFSRRCLYDYMRILKERYRSPHPNATHKP